MSEFIALIALVVAIASYRRNSALKESLEQSIEELRSESVAFRKRLPKTEVAAAPASPSAEPVSAAAQTPAASPAATPAASLPAPEVTPKPVAPIPVVATPAAPISNIAARPAVPRTSNVSPAAASRMESWEATVGGSWLNRLGIALLVIGIAFALGYTIKILGPAGKAALATTISLLLIAGGVLLERRVAYRFYGRGLIAGGWAALYATAYAVHELEATRIVESPVLGLLLLLLVGAGMIVHSLRYRNEGLTTLAYGLAYAAIVLHSISAFTLAAASLLGAGTVLHLLRRRWYGIALGGITATYGSLLLWYFRQTEMTGLVLKLGLGALAIDWVVFAVADFAPEPDEPRDRANVRVIGLLNAACAGSLSYLAWHRVAPNGGWQPLAVLGVLYVLTSATLRRNGRSTAHPIHSIAAAILLGVGAWKGLDRIPCTWFWLVEAQTVVLLGIWLKDRFHRLLGSALFLAPMLAVVYEESGTRLRHPDGMFDPRMLLLSAAACGCFYLTFARLKPFDGATGGTTPSIDQAIRRSFSYAAFALIVLALWAQLPGVALAPALAILMLLLFELAAVRADRDFRIQSYLASVGVALTALGLSAQSAALLGGVHARLPAVLVCAASYVFVFLRQRGGRSAFPDIDLPLRPAFSWAATVLVGLLVWLEARPIAVGPAWMLLALFLVELGIALDEPHLRRPGYLALVSALVSLVMSNLTITDTVLGVSTRAATIVPSIAAGYYLWWRLRSLGGKGAERLGDATDETYGRLLSYLTAGLAALFFRFEFGLDGAALRWSVAMIVLLAAGHLLRDADFRLQGYALAGAVFVRAVGFDFAGASPILGWDGARVIAIAGVGAYVAAGFLLRRRAMLRSAAVGDAMPERRQLSLDSWIEPRGVDLMWLLAVGLAAIYSFRTTSGFVLIIAWAVEGLFATAGGFALKTRSLRLAGLALLGLGLAMTVVRAFTTFDTVGRIVSFLVLGIVLLLVSFGYARYRAAVAKSESGARLT
jgi:uncharacterized membrane protein